MPKTLLVLGARNLGGAIADHFRSRGYNCAAVARSRETVDQVSGRGLLAIQADASDPQQLEQAAGAVREAYGSVDVVVNAVSPPPRATGTFGGGPIAEAGIEDLDHYALGVIRACFSFLTVGARALRQSGGGTLVQITGGSSRRAIPGRGPWAAGAFATRALVQAAAQELREEGIHAALLIVDATIESPKTAEYTRGVPREALIGQGEVAAAVEYLAEQDPRGFTHELTLTPSGERWVP